MKRELLNILRLQGSPGRDWNLEVTEENEREIRKGTLSSKNHDQSFLIEDGILNLLKDLPPEVLREKEHAEKFGALVIQDEGGRMKPINTFASELLRKLSGDDHYKNLSENQVFLSMMMNPGVWYNTEFIKLADEQNDSIREIVGVSKDTEYVKATDFFDEKGNYKLQSYLEKATSTTNPSKFEMDFTHRFYSILRKWIPSLCMDQVSILYDMFYIVDFTLVL